MGKPKKTKSIYRKVIAPILSITTILSLVFLILRDIQIISDGDYPQSTITVLVIECILLFLFPFLFNPQAIQKRLNSGKKSNKINSDALAFRIEREVRFSETYRPNVIIKCPKCKFENPSSSKICFNCGFSLNF